MRPGPGSWMVTALLLLGATPSGAPGEEAPPGPGGAGLQGEAAVSDTLHHPGASLRVFLLTMGRGDFIWERFGHNALWIEDRETGRGAAYNWGIFDFDQVGFIPRLIRGSMLYKMEPYDPYATLEAAQLDDRRIWIQELALTPAQKLDLLAFVQWNALPENRDYRYDYYRDNCSTRVRDALDRVLGGAIRAATDSAPTPRTYRWHTRRLLRDAPAAYLGIQVVLGPLADRPLTAWEEMFLPNRLMEELRGVEVGTGEGGTRSLVAQERALRDSSRPPRPLEPPFALPWFFLAGVGWGLAAWMGVHLARGRSWVWRLPAALLGGGWAFGAALSGWILLGAWFFTDHVFWSRNLNLLQLNPLLVPLPLAFLLYLKRGRMPRWGRDMAAAVSVVSVVGALSQLLPGLGQGNLEVLALTIPANLGLWAGAQTVVERRYRRRSPEEEAGGAGPAPSV